MPQGAEANPVHNLYLPPLIPTENKLIEPMTKRTLLVIEDETRIVHWLQTFFTEQGFDVVTAGDGVSGLHAAITAQPDVIILDLMLPGLDGLDLCKRLREQSDVPIIMLTARGGESDRIHGLELGADDYVVKPFSMGELLARVQAVLRRSEGTVRRPRVLCGGAIELNLSERLCRVAGQVVDLSSTQFALLETLMRNPGRVLSREQLLDFALGDEGDVLERTVDTHIRRLRQRVEADPQHPRHILTVFGMGYQFVG